LYNLIIRNRYLNALWYILYRCKIDNGISLRKDTIRSSLIVVVVDGVAAVEKTAIDVEETVVDGEEVVVVDVSLVDGKDDAVNVVVVGLVVGKDDVVVVVGLIDGGDNVVVVVCLVVAELVVITGEVCTGVNCADFVVGNAVVEEAYCQKFNSCAKSV